MNADKKTIAIMGPGNMGKGIAARMLSGGNNVVFVSDDTDKAKAAVMETEKYGKDGSTVTTAVVSDHVWENADVIVLAKPYAKNIETAEKLRDRLKGKIVIDISNPLNNTYNGLVTDKATSAGQEIQKVLPDSKVIKAFNTTFAGTLLSGIVAGQPLDVFIAGDDKAAKEVVSKLISASGVRAIDAGDLSRSRELEAMALLSITLQGTLGTNFASAIKILS